MTMLPEKTISSRSILISLSCVIFLACGVEVGNPTKPSPSVTPSTEVQEDLALASSDLLDESLSAAVDGLSASGNSLSLLARSCTVGADGKVTVLAESSLDQSQSLPKSSPTRSIVSSSQFSSTSVLSSSDAGLSCGPAGLFPSYDWSSLKTFKAEKTTTRESSKTITKLSDNSVYTIRAKAIGTRSIDWSLVSKTDEVLSLSKTLSFTSTIERTKVKSGEESSSEISVKTKEALVINQTSKAAQLESFVIQSGSVHSTLANGENLVVSYDKTSFGSGETCYPESGSLQAQVYSDDAMSQLSYSYVIRFDKGSATLVFADGTSKELDLVDCSLKN